jgi:hypothetical protein
MSYNNDIRVIARPHSSAVAYAGNKILQKNEGRRKRRRLHLWLPDKVIIETR